MSKTALPNRRPPAKPPHPLVVGARWLAEQTREPEKTWKAWQAGNAVPVPVGDAFFVVRVAERLGRTAFHALSRTPAAPGPVIFNHSQSSVEFFVPATPAVWQGRGTELLDGRLEFKRMIKCPPPRVRAAGRDWLHPPLAMLGALPPLTDPYRLAAALATARRLLEHAGHRLVA
ncbi:hypothetical protein [Kitasatospora sp. NPDC092286]|uniref:hypothetical protein n=1 Tax=Kitasatospora sp. NPDC092286 TaxID=3364087 RepID=UPI00382EC9ED